MAQIKTIDTKYIISDVDKGTFIGLYTFLRALSEKGKLPSSLSNLYEDILDTIDFHNIDKDVEFIRAKERKELLDNIPF